MHYPLFSENAKNLIKDIKEKRATVGNDVKVIMDSISKDEYKDLLVRFS